VGPTSFDAFSTSGRRIHADLWFCHLDGAIAQLGERLLCKQEVVGSIPSGSTRLREASKVEERHRFRCPWQRFA
jgi:hypothetical protein